MSWADVVKSWADIVDEEEDDEDGESSYGAPGELYDDAPGDPVGIRAIQSILMSATQMNLSHFHTAGMDTVVGASAPTAAEAMDSVYTNSSMTFESSEDIYALRRQIVGADLKSFVVTVGGNFTVLPDRENVWYEALGRPMYSEDIVIRIYINYLKMRDHGLTLVDLARESFGNDVVTNVSPDFMGMIDVEVPNGHLSQWLSRMDNVVCGTPNIRSCEETTLNAFVCRGTDVLAVSRVCSVSKRTIKSNNVAEVESYFGIEAAAAVLRKLTGSHIVSDFMTRTGKVLPFTKSSAEVANKGLLSSMGFERPKDDIRRTIVGGEVSKTSVYESIITGNNYRMSQVSLI